MFTVAESPFVTLRKDDPAFQMQGPISIANRAGMQINPTCPESVARTIGIALDQGWIEMIAVVRKDTLVWETLKP
jgi:hypothetical protein